MEVTMAEATLQEVNLRIDGMHCGSCVKRVTQALASVEGCKVKEVRIGAARLTTNDIAGSASHAHVAMAIAALEQAGYTAHLEP